MRRAAAVVAAAATLAPAGVAMASDPGYPQQGKPDPLSLAIDGVRGIAISQTGPRNCAQLDGGTAGLPEPEAQQILRDRAPDAAPPSSVPSGLPTRVDLRSTTQTFNRRYWFVLKNGRIYYKQPTAAHWAAVPLPSCLDGKTTGISVDDDELIAIGPNRQVYTMDGALGPPGFFNWTVRWGPLFWTGPGRTLPRGSTWSWSVLSPLEDKTWTDTAGNEFKVGDAKVSHIWLLNGGGRRLTYMDPWLPDDQSYEACAPQRGRLRSVGLSASGSTVFVIDRYGDMYTRLYDFDLSGADSLYDNYSYYDQRGQPNPAIQLPSPGWVHQPKIRGRITDAISIEKTGPGSNSRLLRVGGRDGFWQKPAYGGSWKFVRTGAPVGGRPLYNPRWDMSRVGLAPSEDRSYAGGGIEVPNFNTYCSPASLRVTLPGGRVLALGLHTVDAIRQSPRARGLDDHPRLVQGTIEAPASVLNSRDPAVRDFVARYLKGRFTDAEIQATTTELVFPLQGWRLKSGP